MSGFTKSGLNGSLVGLLRGQWDVDHKRPVSHSGVLKVLKGMGWDGMGWMDGFNQSQPLGARVCGVGGGPTYVRAY